VRLDVIQAHPLGGRNPPDRRDLIEDEILRFTRRDPQFPATEPGQIRKAGMRSDRHAFRLGEPDCAAKHGRIAGMEPGCDARRRHPVQKIAVGARGVRAERFADVGIQIDPRH
jgi:hypothetical protein